MEIVIHYRSRSAFYSHQSLTNVQQGVPTILLGVLCLFLLPGRPESTDFLTHAERKLAMERMNRGTSGDIGATVNKSTLLGLYPGPSID